MSTRRAKQLIYGTLYLILWLLFFAAIYFVIVRPFISGISPAPQCTTDCMAVGAQSIGTSTVSAFVTQPGHYTFLTQIVNHNEDFTAQNFVYSINLYDASDTLLQSIPGGQSFIYPSQSKYLIVPNQLIMEPFDHLALSITNVDWIASSSIGVAPQFTTENVQTINTSSTISVGGQLVNPGINTFSNVFVVVIFNDANGEPIGGSDTEIDNVAAGGTTNFLVMYPALPNINPSNNQIFIYAIPS